MTMEINEEQAKTILEAMDTAYAEGQWPEGGEQLLDAIFEAFPVFADDYGYMDHDG